jgi:hypothetical protein
VQHTLQLTHTVHAVMATVLAVCCVCVQGQCRKPMRLAGRLESSTLLLRAAQPLPRAATTSTGSHCAQRDHPVACGGSVMRATRRISLGSCRAGHNHLDDSALQPHAAARAISCCPPCPPHPSLDALHGRSRASALVQSLGLLHRRACAARGSRFVRADVRTAQQQAGLALVELQLTRHCQVARLQKPIAKGPAVHAQSFDQ